MISLTPEAATLDKSIRPIADAAPHEPIITAAMRYIDAHVDRPVQVPDVAEAVGVTRRTLERRFRHSLGRTVYQVITRAHLTHARRLLATTDAPVGRIARASGFTSVERMAKVFRRVDGVTPTEYRRSARTTRLPVEITAA